MQDQPPEPTGNDTGGTTTMMQLEEELEIRRATSLQLATKLAMAEAAVQRLEAELAEARAPKTIPIEVRDPLLLREVRRVNAWQRETLGEIWAVLPENPYRRRRELLDQARRRVANCEARIGTALGDGDLAGGPDSLPDELLDAFEMLVQWQKKILLKFCEHTEFTNEQEEHRGRSLGREQVALAIDNIGIDVAYAADRRRNGPRR